MLGIGLLCSGNLGYQILEKIREHYELKFVLTDSGSSSIPNLCSRHGIPCFQGNPRKGKGYEFIKHFPVEVLISVNYLFLIDEDIIDFPSLLAFNIHGSLLPKYRGRTPHVWAIINNEKETGITAHRIDTGCDSGAIIEQVRLPIGPEDTGAVILKKYESHYFPLIQGVLATLQDGTIAFTEQDDSKATYFGKRTPADGAIDWNWQKERIYNWVRAQADPYPGAFSFYEGKKIIIDEVIFSDLGFNDNQQNGTILQGSPQVIIKTPNGALLLKGIRKENCSFEAGNIMKYENRE